MDRKHEIEAAVADVRRIEKRTASMLVYRGTFDEEIYRVQ